jgi:hypothetical protein
VPGRKGLPLPRLDDVIGWSYHLLRVGQLAEIIMKPPERGDKSQCIFLLRDDFEGKEDYYPG